MNWYLGAFKKYAVFSGRARRKEYWYFVLFNITTSIVISLTAQNFDAPALSILYSLVTLLPGVSLSVRRLHDTGRSGWSLLFGLIPIIGAFIILYFMVQDSEPGRNDYGPNPKEIIMA